MYKADYSRHYTNLHPEIPMLGEEMSEQYQNAVIGDGNNRRSGALTRLMARAILPLASLFSAPRWH